MGIDVVRGGLVAWFADRLKGLDCSFEAAAYVAGVLASLAKPMPQDDLSDRSVVLAYRDAVQHGDFAAFQRLGDWALWVVIVVPHAESVSVIETMGRLSYMSCHRILKGQWRVYEELSDDLPSIANSARKKLVVPGEMTGVTSIQS